MVVSDGYFPSKTNAINYFDDSFVKLCAAKAAAK